MKLADDYSLEDNWLTEIKKHMQVLNCTAQEALDILAYDILVENNPNFNPLNPENKKAQDAILQQLGLRALRDKEIEEAW